MHFYSQDGTINIYMPWLQYTVFIGYCDYHHVTLLSVLIGYCDYFPNSQKPILVL